jgi:hypothetical protein
MKSIELVGSGKKIKNVSGEIFPTIQYLQSSFPVIMKYLPIPNTQQNEKYIEKSDTFAPIV